jgi:hypothetical protein
MSVEPRSDHIRTRTRGPESVAETMPPRAKDPNVEREIRAVEHNAAKEAERAFARKDGMRHTIVSQRDERMRRPAMAA